MKFTVTVFPATDEGDTFSAEYDELGLREFLANLPAIEVGDQVVIQREE